MRQKTLSSYPAFDWLRIILASLVYWSHADIIHVQYMGNFAVQIFFALSGWLIGGILIGMKKSDLPQFFFRRVMRIWVTYFFAVALLYATSFLKEGFAPYYFQALVFDLTLTHNWFIEKIPPVISAMPMQGTGTHFWSIAVEEQFYLVAPVLIILSPIRTSLLAWGVLLAISILSHSFYGAITAGVFAVMLQKKCPGFYLKPWVQVLLFVTVTAAAAAVYLWPAHYGYVAPLAAVSIVLLLARPGKRAALAKFAGGISYPMYLNHWLGLFAGNAILKLLPEIGRASAMSIGFIFALLTATIAYLAIDRVVLNHRDRYFTIRRGKLAMASAYLLMGIGILMGAVVIGTLETAPS